MTRPLPPLHERLRRHREVMTLVLATGVTPREAEAELDRLTAQARWAATEARLAALAAGRRPAPEPSPHHAARQWWQD